MLPVIAGTLMLVGIVIALSALGARNNKAAFVVLLTVGTVILLAGVGLLVAPDTTPPRPVRVPTMPLVLPSILKTSTSPKRNRKRKSTMKAYTAATDAQNGSVNQSVGSTLAATGVDTPPSPAVSWSDDTGLEKVVQFKRDDAPTAILAAVPQNQPAHAPKNVPMRLPSTAMPTASMQPAAADSLPEYVPMVAGYMPASAPGCNLAETFNPPPIAPSVGGAVYYKPPSKYPTVGEIAEERSRFWSKPETPDIDRHRRLGQLRDYALTMRPQRSGTMVPVTVA